eukprot:scaffold277609_cov30-Tisochrysis_lutea.AAC.1
MKNILGTQNKAADSKSKGLSSGPHTPHSEPGLRYSAPRGQTPETEEKGMKGGRGRGGRREDEGASGVEVETTSMEGRGVEVAGAGSREAPQRARPPASSVLASCLLAPGVLNTEGD